LARGRNSRQKRAASYLTAAGFEAVVQQAMDQLPDWAHGALEHIEIRLTYEPRRGGPATR
ncbi:MAG: hypothetical protein OET45_05015, partial [Chromatiales bacterium]|nr:hypothetical protein [Chromatiales bacterium]